MRKKIYTSMFLGLAVLACSCATPRQPVGQPLNQTAATVPQICEEEAKQRIEAIMKKVRFGWDRKIYELGEINHPSVIPVLESLLKPGAGFDENRTALEVLAKLRVKNYYPKLMDKCAKDLRKRDYSNFTGDRAFESLGYAGGNEAIRFLAKYLFDDSIPPRIADDVSIPGNCFLATTALGQAIPDGPIHKTVYNANDVLMWRDWWRKNKGRYQGEESQADRDHHALRIRVERLLGNSIFQMDEGDKKKQFDEIVKRKEPVVVELLEHRVVAYPENPAMILLAKMRVKDYYEQYLTVCEKEPVHLDSGTEGRFQGLGYAGGNRAIRLVAKSLFDDSPGIKTEYYQFPPIRFYAARALYDLTPPEARPTQTHESEDDIQKWRAWWLKNKDQFK